MDVPGEREGGVCPPDCALRRCCPVFAPSSIVCYGARAGVMLLLASMPSWIVLRSGSGEIMGESFSGTRRGVLFALTAAVLFGLSTPVAKVLLGEMSPVLVAGLLYLGSGTASPWSVCSHPQGPADPASSARTYPGWGEPF